MSSFLPLHPGQLELDQRIKLLEAVPSSYLTFSLAKNNTLLIDLDKDRSKEHIVDVEAPAANTILFA